MRTKYLIIGNSAGGIGAAEAIRELDKDSTLAIVSDEPYPAYSRPLISKYLTGERTLEGMLYRPIDFYAQNNIAFIPNNGVTQLDLDNNIAKLKDSKQIAWEKLLLACGGKPIIPKIEGSDRIGVFTFTTFNDAKAIDTYLYNASRAVVIGAGLIGVSLSEALVKRGVQVTMIEMKGRVLNAVLDEPASLFVEEALKQAGVRIIPNHTVIKINGENEVRSIVLDNKEEIPCDLVVVAIGVSPRIELVLGTEININHGIVVDRHMATSHPDVYSCGDAAEAYDFVYEQNRVTPIWPNAYIGGRTAGYEMAGFENEYPGGTAMNSLNFFGIDITSAGMLSPLSNNGYEVITKRESNIYRKVILKDDIIKGMIFVGDIENSGIIIRLMRDKTNVTSFKQSLLDDDFGLASLPRELWMNLLEIPSNKGSEPAVLTSVSSLPLEE